MRVAAEAPGEAVCPAMPRNTHSQRALADRFLLAFPVVSSRYNSLMIDEIQVQNLALISEASLEPSQGLTVLTGETGAGKTALLSALKLLMGVRASAELVRDGEEGLAVSGRFFGLARGEGGGASEREGVGEGEVGRASAAEHAAEHAAEADGSSVDVGDVRAGSRFASGGPSARRGNGCPPQKRP